MSTDAASVLALATVGFFSPERIFEARVATFGEVCSFFFDICNDSQLGLDGAAPKGDYRQACDVGPATEVWRGTTESGVCAPTLRPYRVTLSSSYGGIVPSFVETIETVDRSALEADSDGPNPSAGYLHGPRTTATAREPVLKSRAVAVFASRRKNEGQAISFLLAQSSPELLLTLAPRLGYYSFNPRRLTMSEGDATPMESPKTKERSPNYPSVTLTAAVELAGKFYEKEKRTTVSTEAAVKALGYGAVSGTARTVLASLRQYGLLETGKDGVRISDLAMEVIHNPIGSAERTKALKEAAMRPPLIVELFASHADASDDSLRAFLITKRKFAPDATGRFIPAFREAIQIARLSGVDSGENDKRGGGTPEQGLKVNAPKVPLGSRAAADTGELMEFVWQLSGDVVATMTVSKKIELDDVETLIANIDAAKRAIMKQARANEIKPVPEPEAGNAS